MAFLTAGIGRASGIRERSSRARSKILDTLNYPTTIWTRILEVTKDPEVVKDLVVRRYRPPVYDYGRRQGLSHEDAEDVAQEVFLRVCSQDFLKRADREKGKFRNLIQAVTRHAVASHRRHALAARRDARREVSLGDFDFSQDSGTDDAFDAAWAGNLVRLAMEKLEGNPSLDLLRAHLDGATCRALAAKVGKTEHAVEALVYRIKERLRQEIETLVTEYSEVGRMEEEMAAILRLLKRGRSRST